MRVRGAGVGMYWRVRRAKSLTQRARRKTQRTQRAPWRTTRSLCVLCWQLCGEDLVVQDARVGWHGQEVLELGGFDEFAYEEGGVFIGLVTACAVGFFGACQLEVDVLVAERGSDRAAVFELGVVVDPLPELGAADLSGGCVFHHVEERDAADAA